MNFDLADFIAPLDPLVIAMAAALGLAIGALMRRAEQFPVLLHIYWMLAGGAVFFIPLALLRALDNSPVWERLLATYPLWVVYVVGIAIGGRKRL